MTAMASERSEVDTCSAFCSVKEAVSVLGGRILVGNPRLQTSDSSSSSSVTRFLHERDDEVVIFDSLRSLEKELKETKRELLWLKEREAKTEVIIAALKAQLMKNVPESIVVEEARARESPRGVRSERWHEEKFENIEYLPTLARTFNLRDLEDDVFDRWRKMKAPKKKKPMIPLIIDIFSKKRSNHMNNSPIYSTSFCNDLSF
ncbi:uncharacterized protein LOC141843845 [Curcuma longa]|uniref:uncharacterized protein LOC141843845 n=1 Tax=Curcuma longa TaxID=136217 RepID=UPI003D9EC0FD